MPDVRCKSGRRIAKIAGRAIPIPIVVATCLLANYPPATIPALKSLPTWAILVICVVVCATCIITTIAAIACRAMNFLLRLVIIISYSGDPRRDDANGFVAMFRELDDRGGPESRD